MRRILTIANSLLLLVAASTTLLAQGSLRTFGVGRLDMDDNSGNHLFITNRTGTVGIDATGLLSGSFPSNCAILDLSSVTKGFLPPRMTTAQELAICGGTPTEGLIVYNTTTHALDVYSGASWTPVAGWSLAGNTVPVSGGTGLNQSFLGTLNGQDLVLATNVGAAGSGVGERMRITAAGNVGISATGAPFTAAQLFHVGGAVATLPNNAVPNVRFNSVGGTPQTAPALNLANDGIIIGGNLGDLTKYDITTVVGTAGWLRTGNTVLDGNNKFGTLNDIAVNMVTNNTTVMTLGNSAAGNNVGIKTAPTAGSALTVGGNLAVTAGGATIAGGLTVQSGAVQIVPFSTGIVHSNGAGVLSSSAVNLAGGATEVINILPIANGGTNGTAAPTAGAVAYGNGTAYAFTAVGTTGMTLHSNGAGVPTWSTINLASAAEVSGILPIANGGTNGTAAPTAGAVAYGTGTAYAFTAAGTTGMTLHSNGAGAPTWSLVNLASATEVTGILPVGNGGTGLAALAAGSLLYGSGASPMNTLGIGGNGTVLTSNGAVPSWNALTTNASLTGNGTTSSFAINLSNTNNWAVNQNFNAGITFTGATSPLVTNGTAGTSGDLLTSNGAGNSASWNSIAALGLVKSCALPTVNRVAMFTALSPTTICDAPLSVTGSDVTALGNLTVTNNVTVNGLNANQPVKTNGTKQLVSAAINLAGGATEVTGVLPIANGGTNGTAAPTAGGAAYGTGTAYAFTAAGVTGQTLHSNGAGAPTWSLVNLASTTEVTGILPVPNGGTGNSTLTANAVLLGNGVSPITSVGPGAANTFFVTAAGPAPSWNAFNHDATLLGNAIGSALGIDLAHANTWSATQTYSAGVTLSGATSPLTASGSAGNNGDIFKSNGAGATPAWVSPASLGLVNACGGAVVNTITMFTGATTICNSPLTVTGANVAGSGTITAATGLVATTGGLTVSAGGINNTGGLTSSGATTLTALGLGVVHSSAGGLLSSSPVVLTSEVSGILPIANGGTNGTAAPTAGGAAYGDGTAYAFTAAGITGQTLHSNGAGAPTWSTVNLASATEVSGVLPIANGGTNGTAAPTAGGVAYGDGTAYAFTAAGTAGQTLHSNGAGAPTWSAVNLASAEVTGVLPIANGGTNSSTALNNNRIMVSSGGAIVEAAALTNGQLLIGSTGGAPVAGTLTPTANQTTVTNGAGTITIGTAQDIAAVSTPTFAGLTLNGALNVTAGGATITGGTTLNNGTTVNTFLNLTGAGTELRMNGNAGTAGQFLISQGAGATPIWSTVSMVTTAQGTANQVFVNGDLAPHSGAITISLPQNIATTSSPQFASMTITTGGVTITNGGLTVSAGGAAITGNTTITGATTANGRLVTQAAIANQSITVQALGAAYNVGVNDYIVVCTNAGAGNVNLPAANALAGRTLIIKSRGAGNVNIVPAGADQIDGAAGLAIIGGGNGVRTLVSDGAANWYVIGN